jgi:hypothetical protein
MEVLQAQRLPLQQQSRSGELSPERTIRGESGALRDCGLRTLKLKLYGSG